jgi:hypothetical protein
MLRFFAAAPRLSLAGTLALASCAVFLASACVDPKTDYDDWLSRTEDARAGSTGVNEASFEAALDGGFTQTYFMACVSQLAGESISKATIFVSNITYQPSGGGGESGSLSVTNTSLKVGATSMSQDVIGSPGTSSCTVSADGRCDASFGPSTIPGAGNAVFPGQDIVFTSSTLHFVIGSETQLCADLSGTITAPLNFTFDPSKNVCIYLPVSGDQVPDYSGDQGLVSACPYP